MLSLTAATTAQYTGLRDWLDELTPYFTVITDTITRLPVGEHPFTVARIHRNRNGRPDRIRRGLIWFTAGNPHGFHVDFTRRSVAIEAWTHHRRIAIIIHGPLTPAGLGRDLRAALAHVHLNRTPRTD